MDQTVLRKKIARLHAKGLNNSQIGRELDITRQTVGAHLKAIKAEHPEWIASFEGSPDASVGEPIRITVGDTEPTGKVKGPAPRLVVLPQRPSGIRLPAGQQGGDFVDLFAELNALLGYIKDMVWQAEQVRDKASIAREWNNCLRNVRDTLELALSAEERTKQIQAIVEVFREFDPDVQRRIKEKLREKRALLGWPTGRADATTEG